MDKAENIHNDMVAALLEKYFDGRTTLEEEQTLRDYFATVKEVPAEFIYVKPLFGWFSEAASLTGKEPVHPAVSLAGRDDAKKPGKPHTVNKPNRGWLYYLAGAVSAAAVIALLVMVTRNDAVNPNAGEVVYCYINGVPVTDPDLAMEYSHAALGHISRSINGALPETSVFDTFEKLEYLDSLGDILKMMTGN